MLVGWSHLAIQTSNEIPFVTFGSGVEATDVFVACHTGSACVVAPVVHKSEYVTKSHDSLSVPVTHPVWLVRMFVGF
jgi:hypothetical protein